MEPFQLQTKISGTSAGACCYGLAAFSWGQL